VITHCGADFWRMRIGIGHPGNRDEVIDYVLKRPSPAQENSMVEAINAGLESLVMFLRDGSERAMHQLHSRQAITLESFD